MKETKLLSSTGVAETTNTNEKKRIFNEAAFFFYLSFSSVQMRYMIYDLINELKPQQKTKSFFSLFTLKDDRNRYIYIANFKTR